MTLSIPMAHGREYCGLARLVFCSAVVYKQTVYILEEYSRRQAAAMLSG